MTLGHRGGRVCFLAFDHRGVFCRDLFGVDGELDARQEREVADAKRVIFDGLARAARGGDDAAGALGLLVDERFGAGLVPVARERGLLVAMPVERSDRQLFEFEYGEDFGAHVARFAPDFSKVLVRLNPDGDAAGNALQLERLRRLSEWLHARGMRLMFELLVDPTPEQLATVDGSARRFESELRPALVKRGMTQVREAGVEPDMWKLEGIDDPAEAAEIVAHARAGDGREDVSCILLGAGADEARVAEWLRVAAGAGFEGFAIGRSIWREPLRRHLRGDATREQAEQAIADGLRRCVATFGEVAAGVAR